MDSHDSADNSKKARRRKNRGTDTKKHNKSNGSATLKESRNQLQLPEESKALTPDSEASAVESGLEQDSAISANSSSDCVSVANNNANTDRDREAGANANANANVGSGSDSKKARHSRRKYKKDSIKQHKERKEQARKIFHEKKKALWAAKAKNVTLVVLGDIGMSPRMQYHAISLASHDYNVDIVSYEETEPKKELLDSNNVNFHKIVSFPVMDAKDNILAYYMFLIFKICYQTLHLIFLLMFKVHSPGYVIVQNPPSIPTLLLVKTVCAIRKAKMIIDWHNYGYTILGMKLGNQHPLVGFAKLYERFFGKLANKNICVTDAMKEDLVNNWNIRHEIVTLHDKPPSHYHKLTSDESQEFWNDFFSDLQFVNIKEEYKKALIYSRNPSLLELTNDISSTETKTSAPPAVLVSSTSWTLDEDFEVLIEALKAYDTVAIKNPGEHRDIVAFITGKGPMKAEFELVINALDLKHVSINTAWLAPEDYPRLLGSADIGISLHTSSSGLDLPMKIVDMFGCGLPVAACNFKCINELVKPGINGEIFNDSAELSEKLLKLLGTSSSASKRLKELQKGVEEFRSVTWEQNWDEKVLRLFSADKSNSDPAHAASD